MFKLEGKISYLVPFTEKHLNDKNYLKWLQDYDVIKTINRLEYVNAPVKLAQLKEYYQEVSNSKTNIFLALYFKKEDRFVGTVKVGKINADTKCADVGILIGDKTKWSRGIATDAIHTICVYLFEGLKMRKLTAGAMAVNPAMIKVFEKLGFKQEGVFRKQDKFEDTYCDHIYFGCFRDEFKFL